MEIKRGDISQDGTSKSTISCCKIVRLEFDHSHASLPTLDVPG